MKFSPRQSAKIGETTIAHNLSAFHQVKGPEFQSGGRMGLLIYPIVSYFKFFSSDPSAVKILIVGCRSEDDVYWMRSYGFPLTYGFDLFSYSPHVIAGDIHQTDFQDAVYDVVMIGWMISYSKDPATVIKECRRILKPGGLLGIGLDHDPLQDRSGISPPRVNTLNSTADIIKLMDSALTHKIVFEYDHYNKDDYRSVVISKLI